MKRRYFLRQILGASLVLSTGGIFLPAAPNGWVRSNRGILWMLDNCGPLPVGPLDLDEIFRAIYALKRAREFHVEQ